MSGVQMLQVLSLVIYQGLVSLTSASTGRFTILHSCSSVSTKRFMSNLSCAFESDNCGYTSRSIMGWRRKNNGIYGGFLGFNKKSDHTTGRGYFLEPETDESSVPMRSVAELLLPEIHVPSLCLEFWYTSRDTHANFKVILQCETGDKHELLSFARVNTGDWKEGAILIKYPAPYKIIFQTTKKKTTKTLCLDDIKIYKTETKKFSSSQNLECNGGTTKGVTAQSHASSIPTASSIAMSTDELSVSCSFENGSCGWRQGEGDDFDWQIGSVTEAHGISIPDSDHTTGGGHYAFIDGREVRNLKWTARLTSGLVVSKFDLTFTFWYHMNGLGIGSLTLYKANQTRGEEVVWEKVGRQGPGWNKAIVQIGNGSFQLAFVARVKYHYDSDIAIDDTSLDKATTPTTTSTTITTTVTPVNLPVSCDFDKSLCDIDIVPNVYKTVTWERRTQSLIYLQNLYIDGDNSTGKGGYLSLKLLPGHPQNGDTAILRLPPVRSNTMNCLTFAYNLPSRNSGSLVVYRRIVSSEELELVKGLSGYHGKGWKKLTVDLTKSDVFQIVIEGSYSGEPSSFIGIDDLSLTSGQCPIITTPNPTVTVAPPLVNKQEVNSCRRNHVVQVPEVSCSFDLSLCHYKILNGTMEWTKQIGRYGSISKLSNDSYLIVNTRKLSVPNSDVAQVESSPIKNGNICLEFSYIMPQTYSDFEILLKFSNDQTEIIWSKSGRNGLKWKRVALNVDVQYDDQYQVVFQSTKKGYMGLVGIDNIDGYTFEEGYTSTVGVSSWEMSTSYLSTSTTSSEKSSTRSFSQMTSTPVTTASPVLSSPLVTTTSTTISPVTTTSMTSTPVTTASPVLSSPLVTATSTTISPVTTTSMTSTPITTASPVLSSPLVTTTSTTISPVTTTSMTSTPVTKTIPVTSSASYPLSSFPGIKDTSKAEGHVITSTTIASSTVKNTHILVNTDIPFGNTTKHIEVNKDNQDSSKGDNHKGMVIGVTVSVFTVCVVVFVVFIIKKKLVHMMFFKTNSGDVQMQSKPKPSEKTEIKFKSETRVETFTIRTDAL